MFRVRVRVDQHGWTFLPGCFPTRDAAAAAMHAYAASRESVLFKGQVVLMAWYAGR